MASSAATEKADASLSFMTRLNTALAYFDPGTPAPPSDPALILVLAWMNAQDAHIAKYIRQHRALFPSSRILLARCTLGQYSRAAYRRSLLEPALPVLREVLGDCHDASKTRLLVHVFSNGGVINAVTLWEMWAGVLGDASEIPRHVHLMDSCPGYFDWHRTHFAVAGSLPFWASPFVHLLILASWLIHAPLGYAPPQNSNADAMNAPERLRGELRRTYLYGTDDEAVPWTDIEVHAEQARERGAAVWLEKFEGGRHVAHVRVDGERYWRVVRESWEGRLSRQRKT